MDDTVFFCDLIEETLREQSEKAKVPSQPTISKENSIATKSNFSKASPVVIAQIHPPSPVNQAEGLETSFFIDSITGKHISLLSKHHLNLMKITQLPNQRYF